MPTDDLTCQETSETPTDECEQPNNLKDLEDDPYSVDNIILSRTLKRKFTELEEISQRLKSRLLDVTADDNFDIDEEFENDLNTCPVEDDIDSTDQFDWNRFSNLEIDCSGSETETGAVDFLANVLKHSVLNISNIDANNLPADENTPLNLERAE